MVPLALLCVGAAGPAKPGSRRTPAARSHAPAGSGGRGDPEAPSLGSRPPSLAPPGPPLLSGSRSGAWERSCSRSGGRRHTRDALPRPEQEAENESSEERAPAHEEAWGPFTRGASAGPKLEEPVTYLMSSHTSGP